MNSAPENMLPVEEFAKQVNSTPEIVISMIKDGKYVGRIVEDSWFVDISKTEMLKEKQDGSATDCNFVTAIMLAAANLECEKIYIAIEERKNSPFKADTPEYGIDIDRIYKESQDARQWLINRDIVIFISTIVGIILAFNIYDTYDSYSYYESDVNWSYMIMPFLIIAFVDLIFQRKTKAKARIALNMRTGQNNPFELDNNIIISGGFSPFVGSGFDLTGWSFTVNLRNAEDDSKEIHSIDVKSLYSETVQSIQNIKIDSFKIKDELFVDGRDVRDAASLLPDGNYNKPLSKLPVSEIEELAGYDDLKARHYKVIRVFLWEGQIVLSIFFRYVKKAGTLFVETKIFVLPPLKNEFMQYDEMPRSPNSGELLQDGFASVIKSTVLWIPVLFKALTFIQGGWAETPRKKEKINKKEIKKNNKYNYGWPASLREVWSSSSYERYFQMVDQDFHLKMIKETLMDSLQKSLEERNISTEGFKESSSTIFNEGIIISGGSIKAENVAVGSGAQAKAKKVIGGKKVQSAKQSST